MKAHDYQIEKNLKDDLESILQEINALDPEGFSTIFDVNDDGMYACGKQCGCGKCCDYSTKKSPK